MIAGYGKRWITGAAAGIAIIGLGVAAQAQTAGPEAPSIAQAALVPFDIPAQPLADALTVFGRQSGWQVSVHSDLLKDLSGQPVIGTMAPGRWSRLPSTL